MAIRINLIILFAFIFSSVIFYKDYKLRPESYFISF